MKKLLALLLALCIGFAFCACGNEEKKDDKKKTEKGDSAVTDSKEDDGVPYAGTYEELINNIERFYNGDIEIYRTFGPKVALDYAEQEQGVDVDAFLQNLAEGYAEEKKAMEEEYGAYIVVTLIIKDKTKVSEDVLKTMGKSFNETYESIPADSVTEGYYLDLNIVVKGDDDETSDSEEWMIAKVDGYWYMVGCDEDGSEAYFDAP